MSSLEATDFKQFPILKYLCHKSKFFLARLACLLNTMTIKSREIKCGKNQFRRIEGSSNKKPNKLRPESNELKSIIQHLDHCTRRSTMLSQVSTSRQVIEKDGTKERFINWCVHEEERRRKK